MTVTVTACGRVWTSRPVEQAQVLADLIPEHILDAIVRFILDNGRGNVVLHVKDRVVMGGKIEAML